MSSRMEQIIEEIEEYLDTCKFAALSNKNIIVNKEEIEELITELRTKTPDEIKRYQKIIANKEAILADAQAKADQIIAQAEAQAAEMTSEHEIMREAYKEAQNMVELATKQAQEILDNATSDSNQIREGSMVYADSLLQGIEDILNNSLETSKVRYENLITNMQGYLDVVRDNRAQLYTPSAEAAPAEQPAVAPEELPEEE